MCGPTHPRGHKPLSDMKVWMLLAAALTAGVTAARANVNCVAGDCVDGQGRATFGNGDRYAGSWRGGLMHGQGTYRYKSGAVYTGAFRRGKVEGRGTVRYPDGAYFVGTWRANRKHGPGKLVRPSGKTEHGTWADGRRVGERPQGLRDCNAAYCAEGRGRYTYRDGAVYEGEFEEGSPSGEGVVRYANGDVYTGEWYESAPEGEGTYRFADGTRVGGKWAGGKLVERRYLPAGPAPGTPTRAGTRRDLAADGRQDMYAVVVGIGAYDAMQALNFTDDDAYQMYAFLKSPEGGALPDDRVEVLVDEDATRYNIEAALADKLGRADADDIVVFYYSGHGVDGYFVPVDFDGVNNLLSHDRVEELLAASAAKHKLVLADACHSGGLLAAKSTARAGASTTRLYEAFAKTRGGTALLLSSKSTETSLEARNLRSGVFSHFLLRGMKGEADADGNRVVTVSELHAFLYGRVRDYTGRRQTPLLTGDFDAGMPVATVR